MLRDQTIMAYSIAIVFVNGGTWPARVGSIISFVSFLSCVAVVHDLNAHISEERGE